MDTERRKEQQQQQQQQHLLREIHKLASFLADVACTHVLLACSTDDVSGGSDYDDDDDGKHHRQVLVVLGVHAVSVCRQLVSVHAALRQH